MAGIFWKNLNWSKLGLGILGWGGKNSLNHLLSKYATLKLEIEDLNDFNSIRILSFNPINSIEGESEGVEALQFQIESNPRRQTPFYTKKIEISVKNIERWIAELKRLNKIEFKGNPKAGGYVAK
jgi:hypothetical protein